MISNALTRFAALFTLLALLAMAAGCKSDPPKPGEADFDAANAKIASFETDVGFGSDAAATAWAKKTATRLKKLEAESFEGGKDGEADAITKGNFLVYCHTRGNDIVFLVQAPNLDGYEGDVRKSLYELAWQAAQESIGKQAGKNLVIALRGKLLYGAFGAGKANGPAPAPKLETSIDTDVLYPYFVAGGAAPSAPSGASPSAAAPTSAPAAATSAPAAATSGAPRASAAPRTSAAPRAK